MSNPIRQFIDWFYLRPFRFIPIETFRYAVAGGMNLVLGMVLYWVCFNFVLQKEDTDFWGIVTISAPILAFLITFVATFFSGFCLSRYVTFQESSVRGGKQLFRYAQVVVVNVAVNYFGLKLLVEVFDFFPSPSYAAIQLSTVLISYFGQRFYTFRTHRQR